MAKQPNPDSIRIPPEWEERITQARHVLGTKRHGALREAIDRGLDELVEVETVEIRSRASGRPKQVLRIPKPPISQPNQGEAEVTPRWKKRDKG